MSSTELHFPVVLFIMRYKVVLTFEFLDEILIAQLGLIVLFIMLFEEVLTFEDEIAV